MKKGAVGLGLLILFLAFGCNKPSEYKSEKIDGGTGNDKQTQSIYPHTSEFKRGHGQHFATKKNLCASCHGTDFTGGPSQSSCMRCHSYPHPAGWALATSHGVPAAKAAMESAGKLKTACLNCHGVKPNQLTCQTCHKTYPHLPQFKDEELFPEAHPYYARKPDGKCTLCHTDFKRLIPHEKYGGEGCLLCHSGQKPVLKWEKPAPGEEEGEDSP